VVGSDQAKKRFSVLIQILNIIMCPNKNVLELSSKPELKNGTEYSQIMALVWAAWHCACTERET
jgi:hypothetical protein